MKALTSLGNKRKLATEKCWAELVKGISSQGHDSNHDSRFPFLYSFDGLLKLHTLLYYM